LTIKIKWIWVNPYKTFNQDDVPRSGGVYEILIKNSDEEYIRKYIGSTEDLNKRYREHLSPNEPNSKIRYGVRNNECAFTYFEIKNETARLNVESWLYNLHSYPWNDIEPPGNRYSIDVIEEK
jgi:excinuclease UvrABC nuclease subunit